MRLIKRGLIVFGLFCAPFLLLGGAFVIYDRVENTRYEQFYSEHPMLRTMRDTAWMDLTAVLLQHVPVGSTRSDALRALSAEGIECNPGHQAGILVCHPDKMARTRRVPAWYIELRLDGNDRVAGGNAMHFKSGA
jgi:hypothetical protein